MGVMEKFRNSAKYILYLLILSFGVLWALADTQVFDAVMAGPRSLGTVNGEAITFEAFNNRVQFYSERYREQSGDNPTPEMRAYYEQQAWEDLVSALVMQQEMEDLGITVTDAELVDMVTGPNPDPFIAQQFTDESGEIDRLALQNAIESPENREIWIMIESQLRDRRQQEKLNAFLTSGLVVGEEEIKREFMQSNSFADIEYVRFPISEIPDSTVNASEAELRAFYRENEARYQQKKSWRIKYVTFDTTPTSKDTALAVEEMVNLTDRFADASNDSLFLFQYSADTRFSRAYVKKDEIKEAFAPLFDLKKGEVSEPILEGGMVHLLKLVDQKGRGSTTEYQFVDFGRVVEADPFGTLEEKGRAADDFVYYATEDGFETEADRQGLEVKTGFVSEGNPFVPGLGSSRQILNFLERSKEEEISDIFELPNKLVIAKVTEFIPEGTRPFEDVKTQVERSVRLEKRRQALIAKVQSYIDGETDVASVAEKSGKTVQTANEVRLNATVISGMGREPELIGRIFRAAEDETFGPVAGESGVYVVKVVSKTEPDLETLTSAKKEEIRTQLEQKKNTALNRVWLEQLKAQADIEDFRSLVLR